MHLGRSLRRRWGKSSRRNKNAAGGRERWPRTVALAFLLPVGGLGMGYALATWILFPAAPPPGDMSVVPALTGLDLATATAELSEVGLSVGELDVVRHPDIDSGTVVGQSPLPGQLSRPSNAVRLTLSLGPERRAVPEVVAARDDWARNLMEATGFSVRADSVESDTIPRGHVIAVVPEEGTELALPGEVSLTVSLGPRLISMPRVLGMSERQARDTLQILGLDVSEVDEVFRFGRDRGIVVEQLPPAETLLEPGAEVRLSVGRGGRQDEPSPLEQNPL